jgi:outer membrane protein OmpA-like peptidoglycan-associated protein
MQYSAHPAVIAALIALACTCSIASDSITATENVRFDKLCRQLMGQVAEEGNVEFAQSSATISTRSAGILDEIVEIATDCPTIEITITGHTDNTGDEETNRRLSQARAESVVTYLTERGISRERLTANGVGSDAPIASNEDSAGRRVNRRIEFSYCVPCSSASSTSNTSVAPGGITLPAPRSP